MPPTPQRYNDDFRGWPLKPQHQQHPIRGSFLDPRADPGPPPGALYHDGVDVAARDNRPEPGAPQGCTHRVYAIEGGVVWAATPPGQAGRVRVGHFGYGHIDARVKEGDRVKAGQMIGWTRRGYWHVHLTEFSVAGQESAALNPLRPAGKLKPYVDTAPPVIHEVRFYTPAEPAWGRHRPKKGISVAKLPPAGRRLDKMRLAGFVDVRARVSDPQSFRGWFRDVPELYAPHHPHQLGVLLVDRRTERIVLRRRAFTATEKPPILPGQHYAPATRQNLPASGARELKTGGPGVYWFRLFHKPYWNTTRLPNGRYLLVVRAWDVAGNFARAEVEIAVANPPV